MKKKIVAIALIASMVISMMAGCGNDKKNESTDQESTSEEDNSEVSNSTEETVEDQFAHDANLSEPGQEPICKETVSLTIGVAQQANVEDFETNFQTLMLEKDLNYDLTFQIYPSGEFQTQLNLAVSAGGEGLPDVILTNGISDGVINSWGSAGAIIPLNDYYENSSYYLKEAIDRTGVDFTSMLVYPDGNMYCVPQYNQSLTNEYPCKIWIYKPWLDKLGLNVPTTPAELEEVLVAFKEQDPNGNGIADEVPLISKSKTDLYWFEALMTPFQYLPGSQTSVEKWFTVEDGVVEAAFATEGYREGLRYISRLFDRGAIDPLTFTNDETQTKALLAQETTIVGCFIAQSMGSMPAGDSRIPEYVGIAPLIGEDGVQFTSYEPSIVKPGGVITSQCENPEAAFRLLDYLVSEKMSIHTRWGEEGVDWLHPEDGEKGMYEDLGYEPVLKAVLPWGQPQNKHWFQQGPYIRQYSIALGTVWDGNETDAQYQISKIQGEYTGKHPDEVITKLIYTDEEQETVQSALYSVDAYVKEMIANFSTSNGVDINDDKAWESYLDNLNNMGLEDLTNTVQTAYDRMYK